MNYIKSKLLYIRLQHLVATLKGHFLIVMLSSEVKTDHFKAPITLYTGLHRSGAIFIPDWAVDHTTPQ